MSRRLIFVYNANSGFINAITDLVHKSIKPSTYPCDLCKITFDVVTMNRIWKQYINDLPLTSNFLHKDEFEKSYPNINSEYPVVLINDGSAYTTLIYPEDFNKLNDSSDLMALLTLRLKESKLI